jgi:hypothetical protein
LAGDLARLVVRFALGGLLNAVQDIFKELRLRGEAADQARQQEQGSGKNGYFFHIITVLLTRVKRTAAPAPGVTIGPILCLFCLSCRGFCFILRRSGHKKGVRRILDERLLKIAVQLLPDRPGQIQPGLFHFDKGLADIHRPSGGTGILDLGYKKLIIPYLIIVFPEVPGSCALPAKMERQRIAVDTFLTG